MPDTTVKYFDSTMSGSPALSGTAGALIGVLDACLVNGFGSVTLTSLVVASNVATATVSGGHNFAMVGTVGAVGPVVRIEGATPAGLNGDWRLASVPDSTSFTFATTGITDQTASGTITAKRAPAGFEKAFTGTNKAAYRSLDAQGTQLYLRVVDSTTTYATVIGYEAMSDVDTGTNAFNSAWYWMKSNAADSGARAWRLMADSRAFYLFPYWHGSYPADSEGYVFGDIQSYRNAGDPFGCALIAAVTAPSYPGGNAGDQTEFYALGGEVGHVLARSYTQVGSAVAFTKIASALNSRMGVSSIITTVPEPMNYGALVSPVWVREDVTIRGELPGCFSPITNLFPNDGQSVVVPDRGTVLFVRLGYGAGNDYGRVGIQMTGSWR